MPLPVHCSVYRIMNSGAGASWTAHAVATSSQLSTLDAGASSPAYRSIAAGNMVSPTHAKAS